VHRRTCIQSVYFSDGRKTGVMPTRRKSLPHPEALLAGLRVKEQAYFGGGGGTEPLSPRLCARRGRGGLRSCSSDKEAPGVGPPGACSSEGAVKLLGGVKTSSLRPRPPTMRPCRRPAVSAWGIGRLSPGAQCARRNRGCRGRSSAPSSIPVF
jgi:hypothetical protein